MDLQLNTLMIMYMSILVKPKVKPGYFKDRIMAIHGKNLSITCRASGKPSADILWLRDGQPLRISPKTTVVEFDSTEGVYISESILILAPARRQYDNGKYICLAKNNYGEDSRSTTLRLLCRYIIQCVENNDLGFYQWN